MDSSSHPRPWWSRLLINPILWLGLLVALPLALHVLLVPIRFNQYFVEALEIRRGGAAWPYLKSTVYSAWTSGWNTLSGHPQWERPDLEQPEEVLHYVFSWLPNQAEVYPTEAFYYYSFPLDSLTVWGNLGTAAFEKGQLDLAYFTVPESQTRIRSFGPKEGVTVQTLGKGQYAVSYRGRTVRFRQSDLATIPPRNIKLAATEEFVGRVHDESGVRLLLMYDNRAWTFYYVLDEEGGRSERLQAVGYGLEVGQRTGFVYALDSTWNRRILVGVHQKNIEQNNFYDGPCDQVPFKAPLRDRLHRAYPNSLLEDGVDEHGVWLNREVWERLAICAFRRYREIAELIPHLQACQGYQNGPKWWDCMSREWWNTPFWRQMMLQRLIQDGKNPPLKPGEASYLE